MKNRFPGKVISSWAMYDFANSAYLLLIPAVSFAVYFRTVVCAGKPNSDLIWSVVVSLTLGFAGLISPLLGALVDVARIRRLVFISTTLVSCLFTAMLMWVGPGEVWKGAAVFFVAHFSYSTAIFMYDSYLKEISTRDNSSRISGFGWGLGYLGGILCLLLCYPLLSGGLSPENLDRYRYSFGVTAVFYALFSIPGFLWLPKQSRVGSSDSLPRAISAAYKNVMQTLSHWRTRRQTFRFLGSFYFLSDAIVTVIFFTAVYLQTNYGLSVVTILKLTLLVQGIGIIATPLLGILGDRWSKKYSILLTVVIWCGVILLMVLGSGSWVPVAMSCLMGLVIGSTQALCRAMYADMIPASEAAQYFGFNTFAGKVSSMFGPILFGIVSSVSGSQRIGLLSLLIFFVMGAVLLWGVDEGRSRSNSS